MAQSNLQTNKFASVQSIHSMVSMGYLPPGHGYIPKKVKPDKPYGPSYITILNRTWRGPGHRWLKYALVALCLAGFFYISAALYFGHRNVQRLIVKNTEPLGACLLIAALLMTGAMFRFIYQARLESNRWRSFLRFRADGLFHVMPTNDEYSPEDPMTLSTGTYGPRAVKEIPKPRYMKKSRPASRSGGRKGAQLLTTLAEGDENSTIDEDDVTKSREMLVPPGYREDMVEVHQPMPTRFDQPDRSFPPPPPQVEKFIPLDRMPTTEIRGPPDSHMLPFARMTPEPRMPPGMERAPQSLERTFEGRYTTEPRMAPGAARLPSTGRMPPAQERMAPGTHYTPEPRMAPGTHYTPEPRMVPGSTRQAPEPRMVPGSTRQAPEPRIVPGSTRQAPEPRMVPGQGRTPTAPPARIVPGSQRPAAGRPPPRGLTNQGLNEDF